jgi:fructokinase
VGPNQCILTLEARGLLARKGAPETFDVAGFAQILQAVSSGKDVAYPTFSRARDQVVAKGARIGSADHTVLVEGNYLLLDQPGWRDLRVFWDFTLLLDVPFEILEQRLVTRWLDHGLDLPAARARARGNDLRNAGLVQAQAMPSDLIVRSV